MDVFKIEVHPAADVFPMLPADELQELAEDIKANGLQHPIVVKDGKLVDGRNRREACRIAGVKPSVVQLKDGQDAEAYILSANINRRHLTKGQRAMVVARICPDPEKGGRGKTVLKPDGISKQRISDARTVLKWAPEMVESVMSGAVGLDLAYTEAQKRKAASEGPAMRLAALREEYPELADKVVEENLKLEDAEAAAKGRRETERATRQGLYDVHRRLCDYMSTYCTEKNRAIACETLRNHFSEFDWEVAVAEIGGWAEELRLTYEELDAALSEVMDVMGSKENV